MWFRFCPNLPSQVKQGPEQDGEGLQALLKLQPSDRGEGGLEQRGEEGRLLLEGGDEVTDLFKYVGKMLQEDTYQLGRGQGQERPQEER